MFSKNRQDTLRQDREADKHIVKIPHIFILFTAKFTFQSTDIVAPKLGLVGEGRV